MPVFTFYLHDSRKSVPAFEIQVFDDVDPALDHGKRLLAERPRYNAVEITRDDDSIAHLSRDAV
jgi:hypothetical protein